MAVRTLPRAEAGQKTTDELAEELELNPEQGLTNEEAERRLESIGPNKLRQKKSRGPLQVLVEQFKTPIIWLLLVAGVVALLFGQTVEGIAVFAVIVVNAVIGFITELRAVQSMQALMELSETEVTVRRDGQITNISASKVVPGDVVLLDSGDVVGADVRLFEANRFQADESTLTGESEAVSKQSGAIDEEVELAEQTNMVFKGTAIIRGSGKGIVVSTGMETELGQIAEMVDEAEEETTPLEKRLDDLGKRLIWLTLAVAAVVTVSGIIGGRDLLLMVETGIALAIASVPEGLPITATIALARGMKRMADRNALVTRLATVETLGSTNIICTDKTGTLTEGRMSVQTYALAEGRIQVTGEALTRQGTFQVEKEDEDGTESGNEDANEDASKETINPEEWPILDEALQVGVLCSNASITWADSGESQESEGSKDAEGERDKVAETTGEPIEVALLVAGAKSGYSRDELLQKYPEEREVAFDPEMKMMATYHSRAEDAGSENGTGGNGEGEFRVAVKGAPEAVLEVCDRIRTRDGDRPFDEDEKEAWQERNTEAAKQGLRVLGLATKTVTPQESSHNSVDEDDPYTNLTFLGMVMLLDPPREAVRETIQACNRAGVRIVMVTGDQELTARKVAEVIGLEVAEDGQVIHGSELSEDPNRNDAERQRLRQARILTRVSPGQKLTLISLHQDHGDVVAMTGDGVNDAPALKKADIGVAMGSASQVAQEAADMVLQNDDLNTVVQAIKQGRIIFENLRTFMIYLFSSNVSTIFTVGVASVLNAPLPLLPLQILFLNVVVDVFPALALGVSKGDDTVMDQPPREAESSILERRHWTSIGVYGGLIASSVLGAFWLAHQWLGLSGSGAVTISFLTLMLAKLWHVFNMRSQDEHPLVNRITRTPYIWMALGLCLVLIAAAIYLPGLSTVLEVVAPGVSGWGLALGMSLIPLAVGQALKAARVLT